VSTSSKGTIRERTRMTAFTYHRVPHRASSVKEWIRRGKTIRSLDWMSLRFPPRSHCPSADSDQWDPLHRRLPLPLLDRRRPHALAQILAHLAEEVDPSKNLALQLRRLYPLLRRNFRPLQREILVAEANSSSRPPPHRGWPPFRPVYIFSLLVRVGAWLSSSFWRTSPVCRPCRCWISVGDGAIDGGAIVDDWPRGFDSIPCQRSALIAGTDTLSGGLSDDPFRSSSRVGSPYQSFTCMKYTKVLWLSPRRLPTPISLRFQV